MNAIPNMNISDITNKVLSSTPNAGEDIADKISTDDTSTATNTTPAANAANSTSTGNTANSTSTGNKATATPVDFKKTHGFGDGITDPTDNQIISGRPDPEGTATSPKGKNKQYTYDDFLNDMDDWKMKIGYSDEYKVKSQLLAIKNQVNRSNASDEDKKRMLDNITFIQDHYDDIKGDNHLNIFKDPTTMLSTYLRKLTTAIKDYKDKDTGATAPAANATTAAAPATTSTTAPTKATGKTAPAKATGTAAAPAKATGTAATTDTPSTSTPTTPTPDTGKSDDDATKDDDGKKDNLFMTAAEQEHSDNVIAEADKVINDLNASEADKNEAYTNKIIENARQATAKTKSDEVEQDTNTAKDYAKGVGQVVDPEYAKNLPKTIIEAYNNGDFGTVGSDDAMDTLGYFILNTIGTGLTNSTQYFPGAYGGKGTQQTPAYQGMLSKELENAIQRKNDTINKKNDDARELVNKGAISQTSLNSAQNKWAQDQQQNVYAKTLEGYQQVAAALGDEVLGEYIQGLDKDKAATLSLGNLLLNGGDAQKGAALFIQALGPEKAKEALGKISKAVSDNTAFTSKEKTILDAQNSQALAKVTADAGADAAIKTAKGTLDTELAKMSATAQFEINKQIAIMQEKYALEKDLEKAKAGIQKELMQMQHKYNMTEDALKAAETMVVSVVGTGAKAAAMASDKHAKLYYRIGGWRK